MMSLSRRHALVSVAIMAAATSRGAFASGALTVVEPYGPASSVQTALELLRKPLTAHLGRPLEITQVAGDAGGLAIDRVAAAPPDGEVLLATQLLSPYATRSDRRPPISLRDLKPIAKLTNAISAALIVRPDSPLKNWADFAAAAKQRRLVIAWNPHLLFSVPLSLMERGLGVRFADVRTDDRAAVFDALASGRADAGLLPTVSVLSDWPNLKARPLLTFGGERNPQLAADVPTWREVAGNGKATAIAGSIGLFGPPGMSDAVARTLTEAFIAAGSDKAALAEAAAHYYPLAVSGPDVLQATMERDARVIAELAAHIRAAPDPS